MERISTGRALNQGGHSGRGNCLETRTRARDIGYKSFVNVISSIRGSYLSGQAKHAL